MPRFTLYVRVDYLICGEINVLLKKKTRIRENKNICFYTETRVTN